VQYFGNLILISPRIANYELLDESVPEELPTTTTAATTLFALAVKKDECARWKF